MCLLLASAFFSLAAQTSQNASVYIPPVTGTGIDQRDNSLFFMLIYNELSVQSHITIGAYDSSDYTMTGRISPIGMSATTCLFEYRIDLDLQNNRTGQIVEQWYIYSNLDNADFAMKRMMSNVIALIQPMPPVGPVQPDTPAQEYSADWRDRRLFFGFTACWDPHVYFGDSASIIPLNFGAGLYSEYQFLDFLSIETGFEIARDWINVDDKDNENNYREYKDWVLGIPLLLKVVLRSGDSLLLQPYGGVSLNIPLLGVTIPPLFTLIAGYQHGIKAGPGAILFDFRLSADLGKSGLVDLPRVNYQRYGLSAGMGYKFGIFPKAKKR